jgi:hypothetical protein
LQTNGTGYSRVPETSLGNDWVVVRCSACFRPGHSRENQLVTFSEDIVNSVDEGLGKFSKEFG